EEVAVREGAALGAAGGARGVDDGGDGVRAEGGPAVVQLPGGDAGACGAELRHGPGVDLPDVLEQRQPVAYLADDGLVLRGLGDDGDGTRVAEDPLDLLGGGGLVHRDGDRAR